MRTWQEWVNGFNAVPTKMVEKLWVAYPDEWCEVTRPAKGDRVYVFETGSGEVFDLYCDNLLYKVRLDDGSIWRGRADLMEVRKSSRMPLWKTMWAFSDSLDNEWLEEKGGIALMSQYGFRIFKSFDLGYFFGIDKKASVWLPLYEERCASTERRSK